MSDLFSSRPLGKEVSGAFRIAFGLIGLITLAVGLLILIWPGKSAVVVTAILAIYAIIVGIVYGAVGLFGSGRSGWARVGHVVVAVLFILAGIIAFANLRAAAVAFAVVVAIFIAIAWIFEGVVALATLGSAESKPWSIFFAIISILAGIVLLFSPLYIVMLWWFLGIALVVLGVVQIVRAFMFGKTAG